MKFIINSDILNKMILAFMPIRNEFNLFFSDKKMVAQSLSEGYSKMCEIEIDNKILGEIKNKDIKEVRLSIKNIKKFIPSIKNKPIDITIDNEYISLKYKHRKLTQRLIDQSEIIQFTLPDEQKNAKLKFDYELNIRSDNIKETIKLGNDIGNDCRISTKEKKGLFFNIADSEELTLLENSFRDLSFKKLKNSDSQFETSYLNDIFTNIHGSITMLGTTDAPLKVIDESIKGMKIKYMVAPKVSED